MGYSNKCYSNANVKLHKSWSLTQESTNAFYGSLANLNYHRNLSNNHYEGWTLLLTWKVKGAVENICKTLNYPFITFTGCRVNEGRYVILAVWESKYENIARITLRPVVTSQLMMPRYPLGWVDLGSGWTSLKTTHPKMDSNAPLRKWMHRPLRHPDS